MGSDFAVVGAGAVVTLDAQHAASGAVRIDSDDIGGVVRGPSGHSTWLWTTSGDRAPWLMEGGKG